LTVRDCFINLGFCVRRVLLFVLAATLLVAVALAAAWSSLALWYRVPAPEIARGLAASLFGLLGTATIVAVFTRLRRAAVVVFAVAFGAVLVWWSTIEPLAQADWASDVSRQVTGTRNGDLLTLTNVRAFEWSGTAEPTERWETRTYDIAKIQTADLFMSYWAGPQMAHVIMSFGFEGGQYLAWSIEVRRRKGGEFSPLADLFKSNPLVIIAADERDVVGVRSNVRHEDVQMYRLRAQPDTIRTLLLEYVRDANALATKPEFYNSITTNCTTTIVKMMRAVGDKLPLDWRLIVNGYLPDYAYERGALDTRLPLPALRELAKIDRRAEAAGLTPEFSRLIRVGVPTQP
jgi:hypothetical protein